jgi:hypothetical protein
MNFVMENCTDRFLIAKGGLATQIMKLDKTARCIEQQHIAAAGVACLTTKFAKTVKYIHHCRILRVGEVFLIMAFDNRTACAVSGGKEKATTAGGTSDRRGLKPIRSSLILFRTGLGERIGQDYQPSSLLIKISRSSG